MAAMDAKGTILVPVWRDKGLVVKGPAPRAFLPTVATASALIDAATEIVWLGLLGGEDCFALDIGAMEDPSAHPAIAGRSELWDMRMAGGLLPAAETEVLAYARGMLNWHRTHHFCSSCGRETKPREGGHVRLCENEDLKHFPRTDSAVMVLVANGDRCVLARQPMWPKGMVSVVAGFVEPGESMEDAVVREVKEELGLDVTDLRYFRSQAWPFPASIMIGFSAKSNSDVLTVDHEELEEARWYSREELKNPSGFWYPPPYSLAHHLIQEFLQNSSR
jgi:NAD+ diphosphatase